MIGIIAISAYKLTTKSIGKDKLLWAIYLVSAAVTIITESEIVWLFLARGRAGVAGEGAAEEAGSAAAACRACSRFCRAAAGRDPGRRQRPTGRCCRRSACFSPKPAPSSSAAAWRSCRSCTAASSTNIHWLTERQFVDAVAVAMITPGPVVITVGFIGYLVAGFPGAVVAALGTFLPCYLFTIIPAPYFKKHGKQPGIVAFVDGVTAAAIGTITGAVVVLGKRSITDLPTILLAVVTVVLIWKFKKLPEPVIVLAAALIGLVVYPLIKT